jgi:hypothetical protein
VGSVSNPGKVVHDLHCPRCGNDASTTYTKAPDSGYLYTCYLSYAHDGEGSVTWTANPLKGANAPTGWTTEGVTTNLVDPLLTIMQAFPPVWLEHGVIEYQLRLDRPDLFGQHVADRGHYLTGATQATASSVRFAAALLRLERLETVAHRMAPATGAWAYNQEVGYWALAPVPNDDAILTWADRCVQLGRSPDWDEGDREAVAELVKEWGDNHGEAADRRPGDLAR